MNLCPQDNNYLLQNAVTLETDSSQVHEKGCQKTVSPCQTSNPDKANIWLPFPRTSLALNTLLDNIPTRLSNVLLALQMPIFQQIATELSQ